MMSSGTKRENDNARDVSTCSTCLLANGKPCSPCTDFLDLETRITQTEILLKNLVLQQEGLRININKSHEPMIHRLPSKLACQILEFCLPHRSFTLSESKSDLGTSTSNASRSDMYALLYISSVCRTWRGIAMANPRWWRIVPVFISHHFDRHQRMLENVEVWLRRAGDDHLLTFHVWADQELGWEPSQSGWEPEHYYPPTTAEPTPTGTQAANQDRALLNLFALINRYSHRWQDFHLRLSVWDHLKALRMFCGTNDGAPALEKIRFTPFPFESFKSWPHGTFTLKGPKPSPSVVEISRLKQVDIQWHNVTTVEWQDCDLKECLVMFREAKALVTCLLGYPIRGAALSGGFDWHRERPAVCPSLRTLRIMGIDKRVIAKLWDLLTVPRLEKLQAISYGSSLPLENIKNMLHRSSFHRLTSLSFGYTYSKPGNDEQLLDILRHASELTNLQLDITRVPMGTNMYPDVNTICRFLLNGHSLPGTHDTHSTTATNAHVILPKLTTLTILNVPVKYGPEIQWSLIVNLFTNAPANTHRRPLTTFRISFSNPASRDHPWTEIMLTDPFYIDKESTERFLDIVEANGGEVVLDFRVPHPTDQRGEMLDLLESSVGYHYS